jgi:hypothetical protein
LGVIGAAAATLPWKRGSLAQIRVGEPRQSGLRGPRFLFAACFFAAGLVSAWAGDRVGHTTTPTGFIDCGSVPLPPARFDHPPTHRVTVMHVPFGLIDNACRARGILAPTAFIGANRTVALLDEVAGAGFEIQACSWTSGDDRFVILPQVGTGGVTKDFEACALRHEIGHLNGWPASHPDAHFGSLYEGDGSLKVASFEFFPPLRPVRLMRFPRTPQGIAFRRREMAAFNASVTVTVTEVSFASARKPIGHALDRR